MCVGEDFRRSCGHKPDKRFSLIRSVPISSAEWRDSRAFYEVASTRFVGPMGLAAVNLLLGLFGVVALVCFWPFILVLHYSGAEEFECQSPIIAPPKNL